MDRFPLLGAKKRISIMALVHVGGAKAGLLSTWGIKQGIAAVG